jgi:hypothetical protein
MKTFNLFILSLAFCLLSYSSYSQKDTLHVLFLGNSFTGVNSLPTIFSQLATDAGEIVHVESNTPGGYTLNGHSQNMQSINMINSRKWDFVVLQEQSQIPSIIPARDTLMYPYAIILDSLIHQNHYCTHTTFFMTWGHKNGNLGLPPGSDTYEQMQQRLRSGYMTIADSLDAWVAPVGWTWRYVRQQYPNITLYSSDDYHPAIAGTYLAACVFYATFYEKNPTGISYDAGLDPVTQNNLQQAAGMIVLDSLTLWNHGIRQVNPKANFSYFVYGDTVSFYSASSMSDSVFWDFGDGTNSTIEHPKHAYAQPGTYTVTLRAKNQCGEDTSMQKITILNTGFQVNNTENIHIYPNPSTNEVNLILPNNYQVESLLLSDLNGRQLKANSAIRQGRIQLDVSNFSSGIYILTLQNSTGERRNYRIVVQ